MIHQELQPGCGQAKLPDQLHAIKNLLVMLPIIIYTEFHDISAEKNNYKIKHKTRQ